VALSVKGDPEGVASVDRPEGRLSVVPRCGVPRGHLEQFRELTLNSSELNRSVGVLPGPPYRSDFRMFESAFFSGGGSKAFRTDSVQRNQVVSFRKPSL